MAKVNESPARQSDLLRREVNNLLHFALSADSCETTCTHFIEGTAWTALGVANVVARAQQRNEETIGKPPHAGGPYNNQGIPL